MRRLLYSIIGLSLVLTACGGADEEISADQLEGLLAESENAIIQATTYKPFDGTYSIGTYGGTYTSTLSNDPKTFNTMTARDGDTGKVVNLFFSYLADYDPYKKEFTPWLADFEVLIDEEDDTLDVIYTIKDGAIWTSADGSINEPLTADDLVFWYDSIEGNPDFQQPGYASQFVGMPDGSSERITIEKLSDKSVKFHFPRIIADPILSSNMGMFGPAFLFKPAFEEGGVDAVYQLLGLDWDVKSIPSIGPYHITEYSPGQRVILKRNPHFILTDAEGNSLPYIETLVYQIVPDENTEFLMFKDGKKDALSPRAANLDEIVFAEEKDYTVYNAGEILASSFFTFNQNPTYMNEAQYSWFSQKEFRQAMSCALNRPRIADQVYRGLAVPAHGFFAKANMMYDPNIKLQYTYDLDRAVELLKSIGITQADDGLMYDEQGRHIEFTINAGVTSEQGIDMCNIFSDELKKIGITAKVKPIDFQRLVDMITKTYDWEVVTVNLSANYWPTGGSNVWQSSGNFHIWRPLQETPATEWEAEVDRLYDLGQYTMDKAERKKIYDQYQKLILEQLPLMYTVHPIAFVAIRDSWKNVSFDNLSVPQRMMDSHPLHFYQD